MPQIKTFQDGTSMGTFSQINFEDGSKILISLTQTEIAIFKVGFLGIPAGDIYKADIFEFMDAIYPRGKKSSNANKSVLEFAVEMAMECGSLEEIKRKFSRIL